MLPESARRTNVTVRLTPCRSRDKGRLLWDRLDAGGRDGALVTRVRDPEAARRMLDLLRKAGRQARMLAPNQTEAEQARCAAWFESAERPALAVAGGLAIPERPDIRQIYIMNLPPSLRAALNDLEAAGRDRLDAGAEFFASERDREFRLAETERRSPEDEYRVAARHDLARAAAWIENDGCARQFLARELFGEAAGRCGNCGWCLGKRGGLMPADD